MSWCTVTLIIMWHNILDVRVDVFMQIRNPVICDASKSSLYKL